MFALVSLLRQGQQNDEPHERVGPSLLESFSPSYFVSLLIPRGCGGGSTDKVEMRPRRTTRRCHSCSVLMESVLNVIGLRWVLRQVAHCARGHIKAKWRVWRLFSNHDRLVPDIAALQCRTNQAAGARRIIRMSAATSQVFSPYSEAPRRAPASCPTTCTITGPRRPERRPLLTM